MELADGSGGSPCSSLRAPRRLSRLAVWWIKLGIEPLVVDLGHPEQNGLHEGMHRTLKAETARPPAASLRDQEAAFGRFRSEYNHERPHEAIGQVPPAELYGKSPRSAAATAENAPRFPQLPPARRRRQTRSRKVSPMDLVLSVTHVPGCPPASPDPEAGLARNELAVSPKGSVRFQTALRIIWQY